MSVQSEIDRINASVASAYAVLEGYGAVMPAERTVTNLAATAATVIGAASEHMVVYDKTVRAINHRGYSDIAPENTIPAFIKSKEKGFNYVEADIAFTSDKIPVLLHDNTIDRTSNGTGTAAEMTYRELLQYDFGSWKSADYAGTKIPTFAEFIQCCKELGLHPYIELKSNAAYMLEENYAGLVKTVSDFDMLDKVTWISFDYRLLVYIYNADPTARLGLLASNMSDALLAYTDRFKGENNYVFMDLSVSTATNENIQKCIDKGVPVEVYCPNDTAWFETMHPYISGVTSDRQIAGKVLLEQAQSYTPATVRLISLNLENVSISNTDRYVVGNPFYKATIAVADGYEMDSVTVTMGGVDITANAYADGAITISEVTGDVTIAAVATAIPTVTYTLIHNWDFANTAGADTVGNLTVSAKNGGTFTEDGLVTAEIGNRGTVTIGALTTDIRIEVDIAQLSAGFVATSYTARLFGYDNANVTRGVIWSSQYNCWGVYTHNGWELLLSSLTDANYFSGKTLAVELYTDGVVKIYADNTLLGEATHDVATVAAHLSCYGSESTNGTYYSATYSGLRVYTITTE